MAGQDVRRRSRRHFLILSTDPPVLYLQNWLLDWNVTPFRLLLQILRGRRAYFLVSPSWSHEDARLVERAAQKIVRHRRWYGDHRFVFLGNTGKEVERFREKGLRAVFCNQNAFLDAALYRPVPGTEKRYRAIYDAAFIPYKRHHLASRVEGLALTAYVKVDTTCRDIRAVKQSLPAATWLKDGSASGNSWLSDREINGFLNQARVGLCLSAVEGAMYASAQYLLAGLPVVSTRCRGGREVFFDPEFVRVVEDDPQAVAAAVDFFCAAPPDPRRIRERTLERIAEHRRRFVELMNALWREEGREKPWAVSWPERLPDKLHGGGIPFRTSLQALMFGKEALPWLKTIREGHS